MDRQPGQKITGLCVEAAVSGGSTVFNIIKIYLKVFSLFFLFFFRTSIVFSPFFIICINIHSIWRTILYRVIKVVSFRPYYLSL